MASLQRHLWDNGTERRSLVIRCSPVLVFLSSARLATEGRSYGRGLLLQPLSKAKNTCSTDTSSTLQTACPARRSLHTAEALCARAFFFFVCFLIDTNFCFNLKNRFYKQHFSFFSLQLGGKDCWAVRAATLLWILIILVSKTESWFVLPGRHGICEAFGGSFGGRVEEKTHMVQECSLTRMG